MFCLFKEVRLNSYEDKILKDFTFFILLMFNDCGQHCGNFSLALLSVSQHS